MKKLFSITVLVILFILPLSCQDDGLKNILMAGAKIEKIADGFLFTEGPTADAKGNVYFTDQPNDRIMVWNAKGGLSVYLQPSGRSNGLALDGDGNLWSCADEKNEIWCISPDKKVEKFAGSFEGKFLNGPNDLWISPSGGIYFTDPYYGRTWWSHTDMPQEKQRVYYLNPYNRTIIIVAEDLQQPNGIVGTPDGKNLYVADIRASKTWSFTINPDGSLTNKILFCELGSDGMTIDSKGNLYLTGKGVTVFDKTGKKLGNIPVPENWTANVCFGDKNRKTLFITASKGFYRIRLKVRGTSG
ncbi:MAG: SMP-30/gluconolactonase/LRE family protein [Bacteroidia bacterium]|nr:SMP-30/gluconolactonase/LRE family protein [Bacteroidia bacterium]